jgi:hypothetical protein
MTMSELDQLRALSRGLSCAIGRLGWDGLETEDLRAVLQEHGVPFLTPEEIAKDETLLPESHSRIMIGFTKWKTTTE